MKLSRRAVALGASSVLLLGCAPAPSDAPAAPALTREAFDTWLSRYGAAWSARDAAAAGALFAEDASYHEMPFDAPMQGRESIEAYWARVTAPQSDIRFSYDIVAIEGNIGVAHWRAAFSAGGAPVELDGAFIIGFARDLATAQSLREWWHVRTGS